MNAVEFTKSINKMDISIHEGILSKYKVDTFANPAETEYFSKYLLQGERKGLEGIANVVQARIATTELFKSMPHLATKYDGTEVSTKATKVKATKVKTPKAAKVAKAQEYGDGAVYFRVDRQKWMAVYNGKAEAARDTADKALGYLKKKYQVDGYVVEQLG